MPRLICLIAVLATACAPFATPPPGPDAADAAPSLPTWSQQIALRETWLQRRHDLLLDMMRAHGIDMWIVVNEEFHDDPLVEYVAPPRPYTGRQDFFIFIDAGAAGLRRVAITGYAEESVQRFFEAPDDPRPAAEVLPELVAEYAPATVGVSIGGRRGMTRSLGHDAYLFLAQTVGEQRLVSAAALIEEYLDTRLPEEREHYARLVALTEDLAQRALSNEAITPGVTTIGELRDFLYDRLGEHGVRTWFQPDFRVQRADNSGATSRGFLAVALEGTVIERGDLLHVDFGISAMGFDTDWQKMAYVLREGETEAPAGLRAALLNTMALQDAMTQKYARPGKLANEVYRETMADMEAAGIAAMIYSHPLGNHGHGAGPGIDFRGASRDNDAGDRTLRAGSYMSIELNTGTAVPEWDDKVVYVMMEDPAYLTADGYVFFRPRQEAFYLVR